MRKSCMTGNLGNTKPISPSLLMRCTGQDLFYRCNFVVMSPLVTLILCVSLYKSKRSSTGIDRLYTCVCWLETVSLLMLIYKPKFEFSTHVLEEYKL